MALPDGLYDQLLTERLVRSLAGIGADRADVAALNGTAGAAMAEAITRQLAAILDDLPGDDADKAQQQLALVNDLLVMLRRRLRSDAAGDAHSTPADVVDLMTPPLRVLCAMQRDGQFALPTHIGLAVPWLLAAARACRRCCRRSAASRRPATRWTYWSAAHRVGRAQAAAGDRAEQAGQDGHAVAALQRRRRGSHSGRTGALAGIQISRAAGRPAHGAPCQGLLDAMPDNAEAARTKKRTKASEDRAPIAMSSLHTSGDR